MMTRIVPLFSVPGFLTIPAQAQSFELMPGTQGLFMNAQWLNIPGDFDSFQMEGQLHPLPKHRGAAERIKDTPLPRQYHYFTRVFVLLFAFLLPFGMLSFFHSEALQRVSWLMIPLSTMIAGVFIVMERTPAANEDPFENKTTDIPLTALCNTMERDLKDMHGKDDIPEKLVPVDGYLY